MKDVKISDDGKKVGTEAEVLAYEAAQAGPLRKMHFPYRVLFSGVVVGNGDDAIDWEKEERVALIAFANLAPLVEKIHKAAERTWPAYWREMDVAFITGEQTFSLTELKKLLLAFEEACGLAKKL